jgi:hypothetical protein
MNLLLNHWNSLSISNILENVTIKYYVRKQSIVQDSDRKMMVRISIDF